MSSVAAKKGRLFIISAPSGCGKTTLCKRLLEDDPGLVHSVSMTTRPPRKGERAGIDYRFVSKKSFEKMIANGEFLEYEENFGHLYGTPKRFIHDRLKQGQAILLSIDVKGAMKVRAAFPKESIQIFILPPSIAALKRRLNARMTDDAQDVSTRLKLAKKEISCKAMYDYRVINDSLDNAYRRLKKIIVQESEITSGYGRKICP